MIAIESLLDDITCKYDEKITVADVFQVPNQRHIIAKGRTLNILLEWDRLRFAVTILRFPLG